MNQSIFTLRDTHNFYANSGLVIENNTGTFRPGDILAIWFNGIRHFGVYVGNGSVIDNSKRDGGVSKVPIDTFRAGRKIENLGHSGSFSRNEVVNRAYSKIGQKWELFNSNCESFYRGCQGRSEISLQVFAAVVVTACLVAAVSRR